MCVSSGQERLGEAMPPLEEARMWTWILPLSLSLQRSRNPRRGRAQDEALVCLQGRDITHQITTHRLSIRKTAEEVAIQTKQSQQVQQVRQTLPAILPHLTRLKMAN